MDGAAARAANWGRAASRDGPSEDSESRGLFSTIVAVRYPTLGLSRGEWPGAIGTLAADIGEHRVRSLRSAPWRGPAGIRSKTWVGPRQN